MAEISNSYSTGGGGVKFETQVQALFTSMLLTSGDVPCLRPGWPLVRIKLQGRYDGYQTDDFIAYVKEPSGTREAKLLGQIKHTIKITAKDPTFKKVIAEAWVDFNNSSLFNQELDAIALLTGPLSATDTYDVRSLLDDARMSPNAEDFTQRTGVANFFSKKKKAKLDAFRTQLERAKGSSLTDEELWSFLRSYYILGFDLDYGSGVLETLARTLLRSNDPTRSDRLWERIIHHVQYVNQGSGTVQFSTLPSDILGLFAARSKPPLYLSQWLAANQALSPQSMTDVLHSQSMLTALLIGKWNDLSELDQQLFQTLSGEPYTETQKQLRKVISDSDSLIVAKSNVREIMNLVALWSSIGNRLLDADLEHFRDAAVKVLCTREIALRIEGSKDGAQESDSDQEYSQSLRIGMAETLSIAGARPEWFAGCAPGKSEEIARTAVREILSDADWTLWASLNEMLPSLAEAAPIEFLEAVEKSFVTSPSPFYSILTEKRARFYGAPRIYGFVWALETLAWEPEHLIRAALALATLAEVPTPQNVNRDPIDSLTRIFLPWLPQTSAPVAKRITAIRTLLNEHPDVAWRVLLAILPSEGQSSSETHRPKWRKTIPDDWRDGVSHQEYFEMVGECSRIVVTIAKGNYLKLSILLDRLTDLSSESRSELLQFLLVIPLSELEDDLRAIVWDKLDTLVTHHRRYPDANWALPTEEIDQIEQTANRFPPESPLQRHRRLFTDRDFQFLEGEGEYEDKEQRFLSKKADALLEILKVGDMDSIWTFLGVVESPRQVGRSMGGLKDSYFDEESLGNFITDGDTKTRAFSQAYIWDRFSLLGWAWVSALEIGKWNPAQRGQFLACLPFEKRVWTKVSKFLAGDESPYWSVVTPKPFQESKSHDHAIRMFLDNHRPDAAITCFKPDIYHKNPIPLGLATESLDAVDEMSELPPGLDESDLAQLIEAMQRSNAPIEDLLRIEWKYLLLLRRGCEFKPTMLEQKLATHPQYFCELIKLGYRGKDEEPRNLTEREERDANKAHVLFRNWETPPGLAFDGSFYGDCFKHWLQKVDKACEVSGHLNVAQSIIGGVLIHCPSDPSVLWISKIAATILNEERRAKMRAGFCTELFNSRGAYYATGGREESSLAKKYCNNANAAEEKGYHRLATALRGLSDRYRRESVREGFEQ